MLMKNNSQKRSSSKEKSNYNHEYHPYLVLPDHNHCQNVLNEEYMTPQKQKHKEDSQCVVVSEKNNVHKVLNSHNKLPSIFKNTKNSVFEHPSSLLTTAFLFLL